MEIIREIINRLRWLEKRVKESSGAGNVEDSLKSILGYNPEESQTLKNMGGVLTWVSDTINR